jgi:hypothetical protein
MCFQDMTLDALFFAIVQAPFPLAQQTQECILADDLACITSAISHVPVVPLGKID